MHYVVSDKTWITNLFQEAQDHLSADEIRFKCRTYYQLNSRCSTDGARGREANMLHDDSLGVPLIGLSAKSSPLRRYNEMLDNLQVSSLLLEFAGQSLPN